MKWFQWHTMYETDYETDFMHAMSFPISSSAVTVWLERIIYAISWWTAWLRINTQYCEEWMCSTYTVYAVVYWAYHDVIIFPPSCMNGRFMN